MATSARFFFIISAFMLFSGCAPGQVDPGTFHLHTEFGKYLTEHPMEIQHVDEKAGYTIDEKTQNMLVTFRSSMGGIANTFEVNVGSMVKDYMETVGPKMFTRIKEDSDKTQPLHLHLHVTHYAFKNMRANITMQITATCGGELLLDSSYFAKGPGQASKMLWGQALAMRHSLHQSTHFALNAILNAFLSDLKERCDGQGGP